MAFGNDIARFKICFPACLCPSTAAPAAVRTCTSRTVSVKFSFFSHIIPWPAWYLQVWGASAHTIQDHIYTFRSTPKNFGHVMIPDCIRGLETVVRV